MATQFDTLLKTFMQENAFGASNVGARNPTSASPSQVQNSEFKGPVNNTQNNNQQNQQKTQPQAPENNQNKDVEGEIAKFLEQNKTSPNFLEIIKKAIEAIEKQNQQKGFVNQQQNATNQQS